MKRGIKYVLGGATAAALLVGGTVYSVGVPAVAGHAARVFGPGVAFAAEGPRDWGRHRHGRGFDRICSDQRDARLSDALEFADAFLRIEPNQQAAWANLTAALKAGSARVGEACSAVQANGFPETAPEKLAAVETAATAGLDIIHGIRPAFDQFYATLDDKQKAALDRLFERHRRHR